MKLHKKKIIAREIIYLFSILIFITISWATLEINNYYYQRKVISIKYDLTFLKSKSVENIVMLPREKSIKLEENVRLMKRYGKTLEEINEMKIAFWERFGNTSKKASEKRENLFNKIIKYQTYLKKTYLKILNKNEILNLLLDITYVLLILIYPARFVFILIKWSIKTLKMKQ